MWAAPVPQLQVLKYRVILFQFPMYVNTWNTTIFEVTPTLGVTLEDFVARQKRPPTLEKMGLAEQCDALRLPLIEMEACFDGRPEIAVAAHLETQGGLVSWCEGGLIHLISKAACLDELERMCGSREFCLPNAWKGLIASNQQFVWRLCDAIAQTERERVLSNAREIAGVSGYEAMFSPQMRLDLAGSVLDALGRARLCSILRSMSISAYSYAKGWPDLTVHQDGKVRLVEVKTTDRLSASQIATIRNVILANGLDVSVVRIRKPGRVDG